MLLMKNLLVVFKTGTIKKSHGQKRNFHSLFVFFRVTQIKTYSWDNAQVILVGNKCDMEDERVVSTDRGKQLSDQLGLEFFETSAKENVNVKSVFERLVDIICDKMSESLDSDPTMVNAKGTRLTDNTQNTQNAGCQC